MNQDKCYAYFRIVVTLFLSGTAPLAVQAQQPFVTDDADVTPKRHFHFEFSNESDLLQRSAFPNLKQNTADLTKDLQLGKGQLQTLLGGNYQFKNAASFDFGIVGGKYAASPRAGIQLGLSIDF